MDKNKLKEIIITLQEVIEDFKHEYNLEIEDKDIFDFAVRIYNSESINLNKEFHKPFTFKKSDKSDKPTEKQISILQKNNIKITDTMTRKEVAQIIKELFDKTNKEKYGVEY